MDVHSHVCMCACVCFCMCVFMCVCMQLRTASCGSPRQRIEYLCRSHSFLLQNRFVILNLAMEELALIYMYVCVCIIYTCVLYMSYITYVTYM